MVDVIKKIRTFVDRYPGVFTLGETTLAEDSIALSGEYASGEDKLHLGYSIYWLPIPKAHLDRDMEHFLAFWNKIKP